MIWIGLAIVGVTFYLIYKNYEARLVLALSGLVMAVISSIHDKTALLFVKFVICSFPRSMFTV